jgi:D-glycero-D-manno-heptose 1,7-bisphosphate phosphatase
LAAKKKDYLVIIVTNQAGIGRGYYTESDFLNLMEWVKIKFIENGGLIDDYFFCPFHPVYGIGSYKKKSDLRKPNPGMIYKAQIKHKIDLSQSIMIGDKDSDIEAGIRAGILTNILFTDDNNVILENSLHINNLTEALKHL